MIKKEDIKVGLEFLLPCERIERTEGGFRYYVNTRKKCYAALSKPTDVFSVKSVENDHVYCDVCDATSVRVNLDILQKNGFYPEYAEKLMDEWKDSVIASENKNKHATRGLELPVGVISTVVPQNDWIANYAFVGGSRGGNKRNFMSRYLGKFNIPQYENNVEQSNESANGKAEQVSHPSHYAWLKDLCGVEPLDICRHLDFNTGNAIKYLLRKDKVDGNKTKTEKRIEDLRKAVFYIQDEIKLLEHGTD